LFLVGEVLPNCQLAKATRFVMETETGRLNMFLAEVRGPQGGKTTPQNTDQQKPFTALTVSLPVRMESRARKANLWTSTKPPSLSELRSGGNSAVTSQLKGWWGNKEGMLRFTALCQRTACDADVLGIQLKSAKSFFR
jgi:hypothetical protein